MNWTYRTLRYVAPSEVRVVILGQGPYLTAVVLREVETSGFVRPQDLSLEGWAEQGVLLLNTRLGMSRAGPVTTLLDQLPDKPIIWLAWGAEAQRVAQRHAKPSHHVLATSHPTRGSRHTQTFVGSRCFAVANEWLVAHERAPVDWSWR
jgi:uracil-DNA glycosylase